MKRFACLATLSFVQRNVVKYARRVFFIAACCIASFVNVQGQSVFPVGTTPLELTNAQIILDTLRIDSVTGVISDTFKTNPNILLADHFFPGYSGSDPQIWGPLVFVGHTFNITFEGDPDYFATFPSQPVLMQRQYSLKVYAPGDTVLTTPIYQNDSIFLVMNSATPRVDYRLDLSGLFAQYLPQRALLSLDTVDVTSFVADLVDSIVAANKIGEDSVNLGGARISFVEALYILDSANLVARGMSTSLMHNNSMHYTLTYISAGSYAYSGFNPAGVGVYVIAGHGVAPSPWTGGGGGGILPIRPGGGVLSVPTDGTVIVYPCCPSPGPSGPCTLPFEATSVVISNPVQLNWTDCPFVNYEIQVLRLYNINGLLTSDPHDIEAKIDWSQALDIETNDGQTSVKLTLAEGSGYYVWRVRRISDVFPNTIGDDRNWGPWTNTGPFVDGAPPLRVNASTPTAAPYFFYYDVFNDDLNYIYHRQFVEGEVKHGSQFRVGEKTTFANFLLMPVQEQVKAQTADSILASQTIPDNNGRPMMQTMTATVQKNGFGYEYDYIKNSVGGLYSAADFDEQSNYNIPSLVDGASKLVWYYSDANINEPRIPACDSIPFSRTLNYNDPLNRPKEIVSPGKYHNFGSGHSIKKYYCAATTTELVRIFGDEAPRSESVLKTYTMDQNQVLSVAYTDKVTDKILATCLSAPQSELLDELESDPFTVYDTVTAKTPGYMPSRLIETKTYTFPLPTTLNYVYQITADVIGDSCAGLCATCDYIVTISCRNIEDTIAAHMYRDTLVLAPTWDTSGSMPCIPVSRDTATAYALIPIGLGTTPTTTLPEGTYVVTATILLGNKNPLTGRTYLRELDTLLVRKLHNRLMTTGGTVIGGYSGVTLTNVYSYLAGNNMDGLLTYTGADTTQPTFDLVVGCDTFTLPTDHCPKHSCAVIDFAEYMVAQLAQYDVDHGTSTYSGVSDINNIVDAANHLFWVQDDAHFNQVIFNMIDSGYDCDTLWNCWVSTVDWFAAAQHNNTTTFPGAPMMDWWQHFMDLAEYKLPFTPRPTIEFGSGASTTTYIHQAPFRYFPYDTLTNATAESAFCYLYETEYLGVPPSSSCPVSTTYWMNLIPNYPTYSATDAFHMYNFYLSIKPSSTVYMTTLTGAGLGSFGGGTPATYASMSDACYRMCDSRYNLIADEVAHKYMKEGGIYIEGQPYMSWYPDPPRDTMELSHVYCIASALVGKCKEGCVLTPDPATGVVPSSQILAYQKSMTYSMKFLVTLSDTSGPCGVSYGGEHDSVISVIRYRADTNFGTVIYVPYEIDSIIKVVGDSSVIDSSYVSVCNADTNYSYNQAMLDWLNNRYMQIYDSMRAPWTATPYDWYFMSSPGMGSFGGAGFDCAGDYVEIRALSPPGHFSFDTLRTTTTICTSENFTVTRTKPRKAFINSTMTMEVDVVLTSGGGLTTSSDSIVVIENKPATGTVVSTNGQIGASTIRFAAAGPMPVGGTIKFRYDILMPSITGTDVIFGGSVVRHTYSVTPSSCAMVPDTTTADTCMELFFVPGGTITDPISPLCTSCWSPMDCHACICFHYEHPSPTAATDSVHVFTCAETVCSTFVNSLNTQVRNIKDKHCEILKMEYDSKCNDPDNIKDMFVNSFDLDHFQYTLYYYDRAGNLIRTVAPRGVLDTGTGRYAPVGHYDYDVTKYEYNTLGQLERQTTPDGGKTVFAYDKRGKVRLSQNAKQFASTPGKVSYTMYDQLARVVEAGQLSNYGLNAQYPYADTLKLNDITFPLPTGSGGITYNKQYITQTVYNTPCTVTLPGGSTPVQTFINNRISYTVTDRDGDLTTTSDEVYNIYSYDPHGNVASMIVYIKPAPNALVINYEYDLLSNKVTRVWHHKMYAGSGLSFTMPPIEDYLETQYKYDADKRLSQVSSTFQPGGVLENNATYKYYTHGPLKRTELQWRVQGLDYTYTLQGWLKAINHPRLLNQYDPGDDSTILSIGSTSYPRGKDIFGMVLNYYPGDFNRSGSAFNSIGTNNLQLNTSSAGSLGGGPLYNGNITSQVSGFWVQTPGTTDMHDSLFYRNMSGNTYRYDQLNRITKSRFWYYNGTWARPSGTIKPYDENFAYDKNGNLTSLGRTFKSPSLGIAVLDDLTYDYNWSGIQSNRLEIVNDGETTWHTPFKDKRGATTFTYDEIGQVTGENSPASTGENYDIATSWTPYGKVDEIDVSPASGGAYITDHTYLYDAMGNQVYDVNSPGDEKYYLYDAHNTLLAKYEKQDAYGPAGTMAVKERYAYGTERLMTWYGENAWTTTITSGGPTYTVYGAPGSIDRHYEMHDHLGNIRATLEARLPTSASSAWPRKYYNYYAFGSPHPYRCYDGGDANTFGFNGKERKDDWRGKGNSYDFGARNYESRIGRWTSLDPLASKLPFASPYAFCLNSPNIYKDPDGEYPVITITKQKAGTTLQRIIGWTNSNKEEYTKVSLYKVNVIDNEDKNFKMSFTVTRDAYAVQKGDVENGIMTLTNVAFEPKDGNINHYTAKVMTEYPKGDGTKALKLTQYGSEVMHAEANEAAVELGYRSVADIASGVMIHVGGTYQHGDGTTSVAASEGCYGVTNGNSSSENPSNKYSNDILGAIINQANKSRSNKGKIEVIIEKRGASERVNSKQEKQ